MEPYMSELIPRSFLETLPRKCTEEVKTGGTERFRGKVEFMNSWSEIDHCIIAFLGLDVNMLHAFDF